MKKILAFCVATMISYGAFAAPVKKVNRKPDVVQNTVKPLSADALSGLSVFVSYDMADTMSFDASLGGNNTSGTFNGEKAFGFGAEYMVHQMDNGITFSGGGTYEMSRVQTSTKTTQATITHAGAKPEVQFWTTYGQVGAFLTDRFALFGGGNYSFPNLKNVPGGTWKGKLGYQFGGTFMVTSNMAVDAQMRVINFSGSSEQNGQTTNYDNVRNEGIVMRGRYLF